MIHQLQSYDNSRSMSPGRASGGIADVHREFDGYDTNGIHRLVGSAPLTNIVQVSRLITQAHMYSSGKDQTYQRSRRSAIRSNSNNSERGQGESELPAHLATSNWNKIRSSVTGMA